MSVERTQNQQVTDRAYHLWDQAGRPEGRDLDFWLQAEAEVLATETPKTEFRPSGAPIGASLSLPTRGKQPLRRASPAGPARAR